jgi:hypothetical protein
MLNRWPLGMLAPCATIAVSLHARADTELERGKKLVAVAEFEKAAERFERHACVAQPKCATNPREAEKALSDAVVLRLALGMEQEAIRDAKVFRERFAADRPKQTAALWFAIATHFGERGEWEKVRATFRDVMGLIDKGGLDVRMQAHALDARSLQKTSTGKVEAAAEYRAVLALWAKPDEAMLAIKSADEDEPTYFRRLGKALTAFGEATFMVAEETRQHDVESLKAPVYQGNGTKEDVLGHIDTKVKAWAEGKTTAIEKVSAEYKKVLDLKPEPPPRWVIAAGSRVGMMWANFVDELAALPIPAVWNRTLEDRRNYAKALAAYSDPIKSKRAKPALSTCLSYSIKFQYADEFSRSCEAWLSKNYGSEFPKIEELGPAPKLRSNGLDETVRSWPLQIMQIP